MASLLPPVGMEVFRCFTAVSKEVVQQRHEAEVKERKAWKHQKVPINFQESVIDNQSVKLILLISCMRGSSSV